MSDTLDDKIKRMNAALRRMLNTPPKPHKDSLTKERVTKKGDEEVSPRRPRSSHGKSKTTSSSDREA
jgi:hypothetical protein